MSGYHKSYQELRFKSEFNGVYDSVKGNIAPFLRLFNLMNNLGLTPEQVQEQVKYGVNLPHLQSIHTKMNNQIHDMASRHYYLDSQLESTQQQVQQYKNSLQFYDNECAQKINEIKSLCSTINRKKRVIRWLDNTKGYDRVKKVAKRETESVMQNNRILLAHAVSATLEAIRRYHAIQDLFFQILTVGSNPSYQQSWTESHKKRLVELGEYIQMEMKQQITSDIITDIQNTSPEPSSAFT